MTDEINQVVAQCKAVAHMARVLECIYRDYATMLKGNFLPNVPMIGNRTARLLETLGDILNGMDAVTEEDAWITPIIAEAQRRWPQPSEDDEVLAHMEMLVRNYGVADDDSLTEAAKKLKRRVLVACAPLLAPRMHQPKDAPRVSTNAADDPDAPQRGVNAGETE